MKHAGRWVWLYLANGVVWGCSFLFIKEGLTFLTPVGVAFVRNTLGALALLSIVIVGRRRWPREPIVWLHLAVISVLINSVPSLLFAVAETRTSSVLAGIINAVTPLTSLFFVTVVFRDERITRDQVVGLLIGLAGILVVLGAWRGVGRNPWWAVGALLLAVTMYGVSFSYVRRYITPRGVDTASAASLQLSVAALTLLVPFVVDGWRGSAPTANALLSVLALGVFGSGVAFMWNFEVIARAGAAIASSVTYLTPVVAVIVGVAFLGESPTWNQPVGGLIVLLGAAIAQGRLHRRTSVIDESTGDLAL